ncbi:MAG: sensor histidine kinase [Hyalangium sp.]|uniref:sensor histidine kinase n=1 Tax=Hyalangium sp. TaxID=2028555 RepID=UPI00389B1CBC
MSVSTRILLFAVVSIGVTCVLAGGYLFSSRTGRRIRERVVASQEQLDILGRMDDDVWLYLNALSRARQSGQDTALVLREQHARVTAQQAEIEASLVREGDEGDEGDGAGPREGEREHLQQVVQELLRWLELIEQRVRSEPARAPLPPALEWEFYQDYERGVGEHISALQAQEQEELTGLRSRWDANLQRAGSVVVAATLIAIALTVVLALSTLLPLRGSLRKLRAAAERVGRGDFEVALPDMGQDELGLLARGMNRMAGELRGTLQEKQRLMKAEAEASEREARRYSAMLEETVRSRTSELEATNARLEESLRQLRHTQEQLLFADRLATVGRLAAGVGHEINNPLSYILSNLRFIQRELLREEAAALPEREELQQAATDAKEGAERVKLIVQELKLLSRPDDVALGSVELGEVVRGVTKIAAQELRNRARLVEDFREVPAVWGNGPRLGQVVLNLLINAAHAIDPGREEQNEVRVVTRERGAGSVILEVSDTGCGIPPENLERIFEPFFTTKPIGMGTGLGLSVCRNIISSMGGTIQVESEVGRGTTFRITLPTVEARNGVGSQKPVS